MKEFYHTEDGRQIPVAEVKAMSDEEFMKTVSEGSAKLLNSQPGLLASFRAHAIGDFAERDRLINESGLDKEKVGASVLEAMGAATPGGGKEKLLGLLNQLEDQLRAIIAGNLPGGSGIETFGRNEHPKTPEEEAQWAAFEEKGLDVHFNAEDFGVLLSVLDDAHSWIVAVTSQEKLKPKPDQDILKLGEERHRNWHTFNDFLGRSMKAVYPNLVQLRPEAENDRPADAPVH